MPRYVEEYECSLCLLLPSPVKQPRPRVDVITQTKTSNNYSASIASHCMHCLICIHLMFLYNGYKDNVSQLSHQGFQHLIHVDATAKRCMQLANGLSMPQIHLGVYLTSGQETVNAVKWALEVAKDHRCFPTL